MMPNFFQKKSKSIESNAVLRVIGDRASGKTTYMASLARWPNANPSSPVQSVVPVGENAEKLIEQAQNILEQGEQLEPTMVEASAMELKDYTLTIAFKGNFSSINLNISCKDYPGEFFTHLLHKTDDPLLLDYLEDCIKATGILLLIDGTSYRKDAEYAIGLDKFLKELDRKDISGIKRRIAIVLTKCEDPELWVNRHQPQHLVSTRFPQAYQKLESWQQSGAGSIECFTTSAFGILGNRFPEPNSKLIRRSRGGISCIIKDPKRWRPFGLVAPIYWLCTGKRHNKLDKD
jgi:Double-GTPase 2